MDKPFENEKVETFKKMLQTDGAAATAAKIQSYLKEQNDIPVNIGITGESGSGKSTFVNAFRGVDNKDESAAPTGCVETTAEVKAYPHPNYPNVTLWDLPGIGTTNFPAHQYLKHVGFERFDFFIIISADRFRENDVKLAKEIQKMEKKFYFVRSKIDNNMRDEERSHKDFNAEKTLQRIKQNCVQGLEKEGFKSPQVFLMSSVDLHLYDFHLLEETLERELPAHKRHALLMALPNVNLGIINKKKEALQANIPLIALTSALIAAVPVPLLSCAVDVLMLVKATTEYKVTFGLDIESLQNLALSAGVPLEDLRAVMESPLALEEINYDLIYNMLNVPMFKASTPEQKVATFLSYIPIIGIPAAMALSFESTSKALNHFLNMLAEDAQRVFRKALGLNTSV
ncbi:interferon-inducible GTPase 5-like [Cottoperca gobio]|uniref:Interferon-inducible GTPase 5-like n=1 Tax=Cottoperca gobio TaxID=56716 RepID=A0A6J2S5M0_COTGO|nr:interferon-inducible GTPase 5-like [Cottoperca gobio]XP_029317280.1 interferon-inducible GTPase 5-like [Cottoperca gobio]